MTMWQRHTEWGRDRENAQTMAGVQGTPKWRTVFSPFKLFQTTLLQLLLYKH